MSGVGSDLRKEIASEDKFYNQTTEKQAIPDRGDKWLHRARTHSCSFCMWYWPKRLEGERLDQAKLGRCKKHAPTLNGFPVVYPDDWCGDHKLDETKVLMQGVARI